MKSREEALAEAQAEFDRKQAEIEQQQLIIDALPEGCPMPEWVHVRSEVYGVKVSIKFEKYKDRDYVKNLPAVLDALPALPIVKTAEGSNSASYLPACCVEHFDYPVKGWDEIGFYAIRTKYIGGVKDGFQIGQLEWWTELAGQVVEVEFDLTPVITQFISIHKRPYERKWTYSFGKDKKMSGTKVIFQYASSTPGQGDIVLANPEAKTPLEMFDFEGLL